MTKSQLKRLFPDVDLENLSILSILDNFFSGVMITDHAGRILYINDEQVKIDDLEREAVLGRTVTEVYRVDEGKSPTMRCIGTGEYISNLPCYYRTHLGKVVNSLHDVFPLMADGKLVGTVCFIRDYRTIEQSIGSISESAARGEKPAVRIGPPPLPRRDLKNGTRFTFDDIVGDSPEYLHAVEAARLAAASPSPVMLLGETGTGKELLAQAIHNSGPRRKKRFVPVNCAAIPENLLEGILFGTAKGAFTGAVEKPGLFERADGGTLFLDEVNSMAVGLQAKLLRALQERRIRRVGSLAEIDIDVKIISSANREPHLDIEEGRFRSDLLYRLGVVFIRIPPLRHRVGDLEKLVAFFLSKCNEALGKRVTAISEEVFHLFTRYRWPGNVRELEHVIEGAMNMVRGREVIELKHLSVHIGNIPSLGAGDGAGESPPPHRFPGSPLEAPVPGSVIRREPPLLTGDAARAGVPQESGGENGWFNRPGSSFGAISKGPVAPTEHRPPLPAGDDRTEASNENPPNFVRNQAEREVLAIREALAASGGNAAKAARSMGMSPQLLHYKLKRHGIDRKAFKK